MARLRQGPWSGPECPWCDTDSVMTHNGEVQEDGQTYDVFSCRRGHDVRALQEDMQC